VGWYSNRGRGERALDAALGAAAQRAVVRVGVLAVANVMTCTLSVDHRVVDGKLGAEFLNAFKTLIESPMAMLV
jgi:pyruvate dehydrogenase E2 component (dihydrolipoamide acetyltransferase)